MTHRRRFRYDYRTGDDIRRDVDDEVDFHLAMRVEELEAQGVASDAARTRM